MKKLFWIVLQALVAASYSPAFFVPMTPEKLTSFLVGNTIIVLGVSVVLGVIGGLVIGLSRRFAK